MFHGKLKSNFFENSDLMFFGCIGCIRCIQKTKYFSSSIYSVFKNTPYPLKKYTQYTLDTLIF